MKRRGWLQFRGSSWRSMHELRPIHMPECTRPFFFLKIPLPPALSIPDILFSPFPSLLSVPLPSYPLPSDSRPSSISRATILLPPSVASGAIFLVTDLTRAFCLASNSALYNSSTLKAHVSNSSYRFTSSQPRTARTNKSLFSQLRGSDSSLLFHLLPSFLLQLSISLAAILHLALKPSATGKPLIPAQ